MTRDEHDARELAALRLRRDMQWVLAAPALTDDASLIQVLDGAEQAVAAYREALRVLMPGRLP